MPIVGLISNAADVYSQSFQLLLEVPPPWLILRVRELDPNADCMPKED